MKNTNLKNTADAERTILNPEKIRPVLEQLVQLLGTVQEAVGEVCLLLQQGENSRGLQELSNIVEAIQHVQGALDFIIRAGYGDCLGILDSKRAIEGTFPALLASLEDQDYVLLADQLEYEFQPALASCRKILLEKSCFHELNYLSK